VVSVGLEIDVESSATGFFAGLFQSANFGVLDASVGVYAGAGDVAGRVNDDRANMRIWRGEANALARKIECAAEKLFFVGVVGHGACEKNLPRRRRGTEKDEGRALQFAQNEQFHSKGRALFKQRVDKFFGIEWQQVSDLFADADVAHRQTQLARNSDDHTAFRGAIELGENDAGYARRLRE
jgi:hypothetical protein